MDKKIIVIGAGFAGLCASIQAAENGYMVALVSPMPSERAQSVMAAGGMNAVLDTKGENDTFKDHIDDTVRSAQGVASEEAISKMVHAAPGIVERLVKEGVLFTRMVDGNMDLRRFGGQKKARTAFSSSGTGKQIITGLNQVVRKLEVEGKVNRYSNHTFVRLVEDTNGTVIGCVIRDNLKEKFLVLNGVSVIIATGGFNGIMGNTTGSVNNTGAVTANLFYNGIEMANLEFVQYHPTTVYVSGKRLLVSEAARSEGGRLFSMRNGERWYFMEEWFPGVGALVSRDLCSKSIYRALKMLPEGEKFVYLDMTFFDEKLFKTKLAETRADCIKYLKLDPMKEVIPVYPGIHYFMGGIKVDNEHRTSKKGLYAAGECACQYHGANRLGGNSVLGALHGGFSAANTALNDNHNIYSKVELDGFNKKALGRLNRNLKMVVGKPKHYSIPATQMAMQKIMNECLGIERKEEELQKGIHQMDELYKERIKDNYDDTSTYYKNLQVKERWVLSKAILQCALERKESRGSHMREDYPMQNDEQFAKITLASLRDDQISIQFKGVE